MSAPHRESIGHLSFRTTQDVELQADWVIVGSGSGGSAAAVVLARAGFRVAVIEAGPWRDPADTPHSMLGAMRDMMPDWGATVAVGDSIMPVVQAAVVGGGTVINSAIMVRTPPDVLQQWRDEFGLGDLFDERAMATEHDAVDAELSVQATPRGPAFGRNSELLLQALQRRGLDGYPISRNVDGCEGSGLCLQGCKTGAKKSSNLNWLPEVIERGGVIVSCAPIDKVCVERGEATGVVGRFRHPQTRARGARLRVRALRGVIAAASASQTPLLLQRSGVRLPALGGFWRAHPGVATLGVYDTAIDMGHGATQGTASVHFRDGIGAHGSRVAGVGIKIESLALPLELLAGRTSGAGRQLVDRMIDARQQALWIAAVRAEAVGSCRRGLFGQAAITYRPTRNDLVAIRHATRLLAQLHFESGAKRVRPGIVGLPFEINKDELHLLDDAPLDNRAWTWVLSHLFGGAVMGADPTRSVVAPDLHVRSVRRLHVVCAAALPTTLGVNPQHTIMAVARIVAARLANDPRSAPATA